MLEIQPRNQVPRQVRSKKVKFKHSGAKNNRTIWIFLLTLYLVIILLTATAYYAEQSVQSRAGKNYNYTLTFETDGTQEHYTVKLVEKSDPGLIWITYDGDNHHLDVKTENILDLTIDCRSIAEEKTKEILNVDYQNHENKYKDYFIQKDKFTISVNTDHRISLTMKDIPHPTRVVVDGDNVEFSYVSGRIVATVPEGSSNVEIYFAPNGGNLIGHFVTDSEFYYHSTNVEINFDASGSTPSEMIEDYLWDFGDGQFGDGVQVKHTYTESGNYKVVLVVRDSLNRLNRASGMISVFDDDGDNLPDDWEQRFFYDITKEDSLGDPDNDGLTNNEEYRYNTIPNVADSDGDGFKDGIEIEKLTDPDDPNSKPKDVSQKTDEPSMFLVITIIIIIVFIILISILVIRKKQKRTKEDRDEHEKAELRSEAEDDDVYLAAGIVSEEEEEPYECPECGSQIEEDQKMCFECGAVLEWEEEEDEDEGEEYNELGEGLDAEEMGEDIDIDEQKYDSGFDAEYAGGGLDDTDQTVGTKIITKKPLEYPVKTPKKDMDIENIDHNEEFIEDSDYEYEDDYECPTCGASVGQDDNVCPICGEEFE